MSNTKVSSEQIIDDVALGGNPTTTTQSAGNNTTRVATTAFVTTAVSNLVDSAPDSLNTLNELAAAMNDNASFFSTVLPLSGGTMTGNIAHASDFTLDVGGTILLDSGDGIFKFRDDGSDKGRITVTSDIISIVNSTQDGDIKFDGLDGSSSITALRLDMSQAGEADFSGAVKVGGAIVAHQTNKGVLEYASNVFKLRAYGATSGTGVLAFSTAGGGNSADSEAMRIDSSGRVGIGTSVPSGRLMVKEDTAGNPARLIISNGGNAQSGTTSRLSFYEGTDEKSYIERRRDNSGITAFVTPADDNPFVWENTSGEFMRFTNSRVGIGTSSPTGKLEIAATGTNAAPHIKLVESGDTREFNIYNDGSGNGRLVLADSDDDTPDTEIVLADNGIIQFKTANSERGRFTSDGLTFNGDTAAANALDDYEEGIHVATITCGTSGTVSLNGSYSDLSYTKVGRLVTVTGFIIVSSVSSPVGYYTISLPFTCANLTDRAADSCVNIMHHYGNNAKPSDIVAFLPESSSEIHVYRGDVGVTRSENSAEELRASTQIMLSLSYNVA